MKITKMTRWRVFAGIWIQSLFTSATAFFSLFALPLTTQFGWTSSEFSMAYTIYMFVPCPEGWIPEGWKPTATQAKELRTKNYNIPEMVKTPVFWVMLTMFILP